MRSKDQNLLTIFLIIIIVLLVYKIFIWITSKSQNNNEVEAFANGDFKFTKCSKYPVEKILKELFQKHGIEKGSEQSWNIFLPCGYNNVEDQLTELGKKLDKSNVDPKSNDKSSQNNLIFGIKGCDSIVSKNSIWKLLVLRYGVEGAKQLSPMTFVPFLSKDLQLLKENYQKDQSYILKKNIQRQQGIKLSKDLSEILNIIKKNKDYVVIQELLSDPYCINGHKINLRVYLLVTCNQGQSQAHVYNNGFLYYTPKKYQPESLEIERHITSGYVPREMYQKNPLTHIDLREYLNKKESVGAADRLFNNIDHLLYEVMEAVGPSLCHFKNMQNSYNFQLFGVDIAPDKDLNVKLIEINKGPDLGAKDPRDKEVKFKLVEDIFNLNGVLSYDSEEIGRTNGFHQIWNTNY